MKLKHTIISSILGLSAFGANAATVDIEVTNLTKGTYFTPLLYVGHPASISLFNVGAPAIEQVATMAEGGDIGPLDTFAQGAGASTVANPVGGMPGFLGPGMSVTTEDWDTGEANTTLSIVAMILPSNDAFIGLNTWPIPAEPGTYTVYLNAYDAGSEANDEVFTADGGMPGVAGMPGPAQGPTGGGTGGSGRMDDSPNTTVHIHPGVLGDDNPTGGVSDIDNTKHRWLNPVARAIITVK